jgi:hypothetical protein
MYKVFMVKAYILVEMDVRPDKAPGIPVKNQEKILYHQNH